MSRDGESKEANAGEVNSDDTPPTWADLFARGGAVGASETEIRETLRSRRDA
ncbi:hypothetical protein [Salinirubrum litoreum]|uniref:Uncharacterized protein n=1 Tax=Salinirubrum litoreum TaxID=1126234 RepID=A0ABD5RD68_9EURY|nr:hypothetical protein [Salinirubrum litoreum]